VIGDPPLDDGAVHCIIIEVKVLLTFTGAPGLPGTVAITNDVASEGNDCPTSLTAITLNK